MFKKVYFILNKLKSPFSLKISVIKLLPALVIFPSFPPQLTLETLPLQVSIKFPPTRSCRGKMPRTVGGGGRFARSCAPQTMGAGTDRGRGTDAERRAEGCTERSKTSLTALVPNDKVGATVAANPTFFLYVPKTFSKYLDVEFLLFDEEGREVYLTELAITGTPGIISLSLPATTSLKVGKTYRWQFALICNSEDPTYEQFELVMGSIKRTELNPYLKAKIARATPLEQAKLYAQADVWYEALTTLARLRSSHPDEWNKLLKPVGLEEIAQAPFIN